MEKDGDKNNSNNKKSKNYNFYNLQTTPELQSCHLRLDGEYHRPENLGLSAILHVRVRDAQIRSLVLRSGPGLCACQLWAECSDSFQETSGKQNDFFF